MSRPTASTDAASSWRVAVIVLGDVGRSPRMQYHARALAAEGAIVDLVGEAGTPMLADLEAHPRVHGHLLAPARAAHGRRGLLFGLVTVIRTLRQSIALLYWVAIGLPRPDVMLVQNPPAIPTLLIAVVGSRLRRCRLIIDWHNLGHAMIASHFRRDHWLARLTEAYERRLAPLADSHLCVSRAMQETLRERWGIEATVLYDEPSEDYHPVPVHMRADVLSRILARVVFVPFDWHQSRRPAVIVTSTSWTPDEDFDLLLDAAAQADRALRTHARDAALPDLFIVITGAGRLREAFERRIPGLNLRRVHLHTVWLPADDYARLLGSADVGLSLHRSTSGIDLPMKVADMFGAGLPVCALNYSPCLAERIDHRHNGLLFSTGAELAAQWLELFRGFPEPSPLLERLRRGVATTNSRRWTENWKECAAPLFSALR